MTIEDSVRRLFPIEQQLALTDQEALKALRTVCHAAIFGNMNDNLPACEACEDGVYITDTTPTYAGREHPFCAECGRRLVYGTPEHN